MKFFNLKNFSFTKFSFAAGALLGIGFPTKEVKQGGTGALFLLVFIPPLWPFLGGCLITTYTKVFITDKFKSKKISK